MPLDLSRTWIRLDALLHKDSGVQHWTALRADTDGDPRSRSVDTRSVTSSTAASLVA